MPTIFAHPTAGKILENTPPPPSDGKENYQPMSFKGKKYENG
jgi:hypothetical protein